MKMLNKFLLALGLALSLLVTNAIQAQDNGVETDAAATQQIEMADRMRQDGKIYVVVGCVLVVLAGMIFYLVTIDKKVSRLEKQYKN
jgi:hypothetical protein